MLTLYRPYTHLNVKTTDAISRAGGRVIYKKFQCFAEAIIWYMYKAYNSDAFIKPISPDIKTLLTCIKARQNPQQDPGQS